MVAWRGGEGEAVRGGGRLERGQSRFLRLMSIFTLLIIMMVSWVYASVKTYQIVQFKYVHFTVCQLSLLKIEFFCLFFKECNLLKFNQNTVLVRVQLQKQKH